MIVQDSCSWKLVQTPILYALIRADVIWNKILQQDVVVTSLNDKTHSENSLHYQGKAADLRTKDIAQPVAENLYRELKIALGPEFDVLFEYIGEPEEHIHVEYDP